MPRRASPHRIEAAAQQAAQRMVARGERPIYRAVLGADGAWYVLGCPWISIDANDRRSAVEATRAAVAHWLGIDRDAFDVDVAMA